MCTIFGFTGDGIEVVPTAPNAVGLTLIDSFISQVEPA